MSETRQTMDTATAAFMLETYGTHEGYLFSADRDHNQARAHVLVSAGNGLADTLIWLKKIDAWPAACGRIVEGPFATYGTYTKTDTQWREAPTCKACYETLAD